MGLKERIFDLVFPTRRSKRKERAFPAEETLRRKRKRRGPSDPKEFDDRYFVRHRR